MNWNTKQIGSRFGVEKGTGSICQQEGKTAPGAEHPPTWDDTGEKTMGGEQLSVWQEEQCLAVQKLSFLFHLKFQLQLHCITRSHEDVFIPVVYSYQTAYWISSLGGSLSIPHQVTVDRNTIINMCPVCNIFFLMQRWLFNLLSKWTQVSN